MGTNIRLTTYSIGIGGIPNAVWEMRPMTKEDDYRQNAVETVDLANKASTFEGKARLLALAEKWVDLADRVHRSARSRISKLRDLHPLIRKKLPMP
jgi:hypothetical protein